MSNRLTVEQRYFIIEKATGEIEDILGRLNPHNEWYVGHSQHDGAEERLWMLIDLRDKMATALKTRTTALHYLVGDKMPIIRDKTLREKFMKPESPTTYQQKPVEEWVRGEGGES